MSDLYEKFNEEINKHAKWEYVQNEDNEYRIEFVNNHFSEVIRTYPNGHKAIRMMLEKGFEPEDMEALVLEWPHNSEDDGEIKVAYCRSPEHLEQKRYTKVTLSKYLTRHFPTAKSNEIRDIASLFSSCEIKITDDLGEMIDWLDRGPGSCMTQMGTVDINEHPYAVYSKRFGWAMIGRFKGNDVVGRALVNTNPTTEKKIFVRSYAKGDNGYSETDTMIEAWLNNNGYAKVVSWVNCKLERIEVEEYNSVGLVGPYLDGDDKYVEDKGTHLEIVGFKGEYVFNDTAGEYFNTNCVCPNCNVHVNEDDLVMVGPYEEEQICQDCVDRDYIFAYSRSGYHYIIPRDCTIEVDGDYYDENYLDDNGIVRANDGEYYRADECVYSESTYENYHIDSEDVVTVNEGYHAYKGDCWMCEGSGNWYTNSENSVEVGGLTYHPDYAPVTTEE